ncbi:hypothetical protein GQ43DRAFT_256662 [Delitschia confertaspora ATCC 74209]|uniref:Uncharacterized protein n=1 Tax=Delitschia confertaspora ATCC 74209 TaxID=1513339 RepID=A0A9P4JR07_9PLEO|nr:hypothetical protein GQ43DRAFT_256662 [Delitschia confertaspora ATCC 74209]
MCHTEHVFHRPCCHWGRERFVGEPCIRSRVVGGRHTGCGYKESLGATNSNEYCCECRYRQAQGGAWKPFAGISNNGWVKVEEARRQRYTRSNKFCHVRDDPLRWLEYWKGWWRSRGSYG